MMLPDHPKRPSLDSLVGADGTTAKGWIIRRRKQMVSEVWLELERCERRFRAFIENSSDVICLIDASAHIIFTSDSVQSILGYDPQEYLGESAFLFIHPDDQEEVRQKLGLLLQEHGATMSIEARLRHKDGTWHWMLCTGTNLLADTAVNGIVVNCRDITKRKQAQEELRHSEQRYRALIENSYDVVSLISAEGIILYTSPTIERVFGVQPDRHVGRNFAEEVHPDDYAQVQAVFAELVAHPDRTARVEIRYRHTSGEWRWLECVGTNLLGEPDVGAIVVNYRDITDRKQAEIALRKSEERFRVLADSAPMLVWMAGVDQQCHFFNQRWLRFTGRSMEQERGSGWLEGVHPDDRDRCLLVYSDSFHRRQEFTTEYRLRRADGEYRWVLDHGVPMFDPDGTFVGYIGNCIDITDRREAEQNMKRLNQQLEQRVVDRTRELHAAREKDLANLQRLVAMIDHLPFAAIAVDENGTILQVNELFCEYFNFPVSPREMIGRHKEEFRPLMAKALVDADQFWQDTENVVVTGESIIGREFQLNDGRILLRDCLSIADGDKSFGQLILYRDVTREHRIDAAKSEFMSLASHQLRTPLTALRWMIGRLGKSLGSRGTLQERKLLEEGHRAALRMSETIDTMLEISRIESGKAASNRFDIPLQSFLSGIVDIFIGDARRKRIALRLECPEELWLNTDPNFLKEVVSNLLSNAIKYTPDLGRVMLRAVRDRDCIRIDVEDNGYGIPQHQQQHIFRKFFRGDNIVDRETEGTGLGLYLVSLITHLLGGTISFLSQEGYGTTFTLLFTALPKVERRQNLEPDLSWIDANLD